MHAIDTDTGLGPGVEGYCPCTVDLNGASHWRWIGHSGGTTELVYSDNDDIAIALNVTDSLWVNDRGRAIADLVEILRTAILQNTAAATPPTFGNDTTSGPALRPT